MYEKILPLFEAEKYRVQNIHFTDVIFMIRDVS